MSYGYFCLLIQLNTVTVTYHDVYDIYHLYDVNITMVGLFYNPYINSLSITSVFTFSLLTKRTCYRCIIIIDINLGIS